jgi:hypothetical protein
VPSHPLRAIQKVDDDAPAKLSPVFDAMYAQGGSVHPTGAFAQVDAADATTERSGTT